MDIKLLGAPAEISGFMSTSAGRGPPLVNGASSEVAVIGANLRFLGRVAQVVEPGA
jgi:hypothetical protein